MLSNFIFRDPWFFVIGLIVPLLHLIWARLQRPSYVLLSSKELAWVQKSKIKDPRATVLLLRYLAVLFLSVALARPQFEHREIERKVSGIDIMMILDISASMNIEDLGEKNRFEIAKDTIEKFIKARRNDRIGLIAFSGEPATLAPPTLDYSVVLKALREVKPGDLKDGTAIGDGLSLGVSRLKESKAKSKVIVLLTDGDNNVGKVDPATAGELADGFGIKVYTIAIGKEGRVALPFIVKDVFGRERKQYQWFDNALNPEILKQIAVQTKGKFYRVTEGEALQQVFDEINQLEKTDVSTHEKLNYDEMFLTPLLLGLVFYLLELLMSRTRYRSAL